MYSFAIVNLVSQPSYISYYKYPEQIAGYSVDNALYDDLNELSVNKV